ncbi:hypothetical protein EV700_1991 [Fluviicoccus keumensis]|uniref:Transcriptional initiation protein Tat n=1 Tax=Fluviicoccus keumensis TaxID=1435465 RepID=A0A4Q7Z4I9_9GAMM|nr:transcriptional initiation protein Tat [Fluviicoccus keumensis]RZU45178.1 hypothetical protein EV700_1991 [Fluviicoccus keumensis]
MSQQDPALAQLENQLASLSRRRFLKSGLLLGTTAASALTFPVRALADDALPIGIHHLSLLEYRVFDRLRTIFLPTQRFEQLPSTTTVPVMENLDRMVGRLNGDTRFLLSLGARTLEYATLYKMRRFSSLNDEQALNQVRAWQSGISFQGGLVVSMKTLMGIAYWRDPRTWAALDYDGPVSAKWGIRRLGNLPLPLETEADLNV